ncbi:DEAD/DEAH box helicase [soil metagenome]
MNTPAPEASLTFDDLGLDPRILQAVRDVGYETPSPIQAETIPLLLDGKDVVGLAQTGTGKTAAFAIPVLSRIDPASKKTQALVLAPTRELALQVAEAFISYSRHLPGLHVLPIYGGQSYGTQLSGLKRGAHVVVGTPGRVIDHLEKGTLDLSHLDFLVLDEADEMLKMGFAEDVERILSDTPEYKQVALFSATMPSSIRKLSTKYLHEPVEVTVKNKTSTVSNTRQRWLQVSQHQKLDALTRILEVETGDAMIVFVRTKQATEELAERLRARGFSAAAINGDLVQAQRERTIGQLKSGALDILVATDVAARGLDVDRITHVVNYDIPHDTEAYVHRIGRTGRAGREGEALLFVTPRERRMLTSIEKTTRQPLIEMGLPSVDDVNAERVTKFEQAITASMGDPQFHMLRSIIEQFATDNNVPMPDVAAALAVMSQDGKDFLLKPEPPQAKKDRDRDRDRSDRPDRGPRGDGDRPPRIVRDRKTDQEMAVYRLRVGKRHKVMPGAVVGALANEGGLHRSDFGNISIRADHTLVELPADLPDAVFQALARTRISGQLINIEPDSGPRGYQGKNKDGDKGRKPRH